MEFNLQQLSELLIRQVGKSNVQWFTYPFLPPTTFSGFVASLLIDEGGEGWCKDYIELNDNKARCLDDVFTDVFSLGAYPNPTRIALNRHYRQHLGDIYNYEEFSWSGNKKLAISESFWAVELKGYILSTNRENLLDIYERLEFKFAIKRIGKKGIVKLIKVISPFEIYLKSKDKVMATTISPIEMLREFPANIKIYHVPLKIKKDIKKGLMWEIYPCVFGYPVYGEVYTNDEKKVIIPSKIVKIISGQAEL
jgi:hypothetical protein